MTNSTKIGKIREIEIFEEIFASTAKLTNSTKIGKIREIEIFDEIFAIFASTAKKFEKSKFLTKFKLYFNGFFRHFYEKLKL